MGGRSRLRGGSTPGPLGLVPELLSILHLVQVLPPVSSRRVSGWLSLGQRWKRWLRIRDRGRRRGRRRGGLFVRGRKGLQMLSG